MNIIITGASNGIGYETTLAIGRNGIHNIVAISRNQSRLEELENMMRAISATQLTIVPFDLGNEDLSPIIEIAQELGHVDILINMAATLIKKPFLETTSLEWQNLFNVNLFSVARLINALFPQLAASGKAHVVNISSMGGYLGSRKFPGLSTYSASKAALACLTESLAVEFEPHNIAVNCLALGSVQTEMLSRAFPDYKAPIDSMQIAKFIAEFAMSGYQYFNGKVLPVALSTP